MIVYWVQYLITENMYIIRCDDMYMYTCTVDYGSNKEPVQ